MQKYTLVYQQVVASNVVMTIEILTTALMITSLILAVIALLFSIEVKIEQIAAKRSTHQIQYVPADQLQDFAFTDEALSQQEQMLTDEQKKILTKDPFEAL
jgi:hypothetical protein